MKDYYGRKLKVGDKVLRIMWDIKSFDEDVCEGFGKQFGKPYAAMKSGKRMQSEFIILENELGEWRWIQDKKKVTEYLNRAREKFFNRFHDAMTALAKQ